MRADDIQGRHPHWKRYLNGPADQAALRQIHGIGPRRAALILRLYGSIDGFLLADPRDVADSSHGLIGQGLTERLQASCAEAGIRSDWTPLDAANQAARPQDGGILDRLARLVLGDRVRESPEHDRRWTLALIRRAWVTAHWGWGGLRTNVPTPGPPGS